MSAEVIPFSPRRKSATVAAPRSSGEKETAESARLIADFNAVLADKAGEMHRHTETLCNTAAELEHALVTMQQGLSRSATLLDSAVRFQANAMAALDLDDLGEMMRRRDALIVEYTEMTGRRPFSGERASTGI